jgi:hypothetical protein
MAHLDVAFAQQFELTLDQRNGVASLMRNAHRAEQFVMLGEEVWVLLQPRSDCLCFKGWHCVIGRRFAGRVG